MRTRRQPLARCGHAEHATLLSRRRHAACTCRSRLRRRAPAAHFQNAGSIVHAEVARQSSGRSKGWALVDFASPAEAAQVRPLRSSAAAAASPRAGAAARRGARSRLAAAAAGVGWDGADA